MQRGLIAGAFLIVVMSCPVVRAESTSTLLEQGVYYQDTAGDLDAAIQTYQKILADAKANRQYLAEAQYRLGVCLLKKGEPDKAIEAFQKVVEQYGDQKREVGQAKEQIQQQRQKLAGPEVARIVEKAVITISQSAEGQPQVAKAFQSLKGLDQTAVVTQLVTYLGSDEPNVRRAAIYVLWKGGGSFNDSIRLAVPALQGLLDNPEDFTRGMAALALASNHIESSYDALANMALKDDSGFAGAVRYMPWGFLAMPRPGWCLRRQ